MNVSCRSCSEILSFIVVLVLSLESNHINVDPLVRKPSALPCDEQCDEASLPTIVLAEICWFYQCSTSFCRF